MILGTAGHVDHGKTALVRALTGVDTDRLEEEKRRGITIELGFAPLRLDSGEVVGVVDVPGHEAFVRTMLAGATGVDLALLVIAADEGVMPQTREHLDILRLLGTAGGVVALTKCDLVDDEWLALVEDEVRSVLRESPLVHAPIVRTSVVQSLGLDALRAAVGGAVRRAPVRSSLDLFRMPVDRAFSVHGTGTVVTGTVWSGTIEREARVHVLPRGVRVRVRGIEVHGASRQCVEPGTRAALALSGVDLADVARGAVIVSGDGWTPQRVLLAEVAILPGAPGAIGPRRAVRLHLGTADVEARLVASGGALAPGERRQARLVLAEPVVARAGDRFVLRTGSPVATIGGGVVNDPLPSHPRPRPWNRPASTAAERLRHLLDSEGDRGLSVATLAIRTGAAPAEIAGLITAAADAVIVGDRVYTSAALDSLGARVHRIVDDFHAAEPLEPGVSLQRLRAQLGVPEGLADQVVAGLVARAALRLDGGTAARAGWTPSLSAEQARVASALLDVLRRQGREPDAVAELVAVHGRVVNGILRHLEREGEVVQVEPDRFYARGALEEMLGVLRVTLEAGAATPAALREALGISRKFLIPFLEYCDRTGVTERLGEGRRLRGVGV